MGIKGTAHPSASQPLSLCSVISFAGSLYLCLSFPFFFIFCCFFRSPILPVVFFFPYYLQMFDKGLLPPSSPLSVLLFLCQPHCVSWTKPTNSEHIYKRKAATLMFSGHSWEALLTNRKTAIFPFINTFIVGKTIH